MGGSSVSSGSSIGLFEAASVAESRNQPFAVVTLIGTQGTVPRKDGRMVVLRDGSSFGTIGGGEAERQAVSRALLCIEKGKGGKEMIKVKESGTAEVFIDVPIARRKVVVFGTGHVAMALAQVFHNLSFEVVFVDNDRDGLANDIPKWASLVEKEAFCEVLRHESPSNGNTIVDDRTAVLFSNPDEVDSFLDAVLETRTPYIGVLASRKRKVQGRYGGRRIHMPMGLDVGAQTPNEIAIAVALEVMAVFNGKSAQPSSLWKNRLVVVRGAGDLATAVGIRLHNAGFDVIHLEAEKPTVIRRTVSFASALFDGSAEVEGVVARKCNAKDVLHVLDDGEVPVVVDPSCSILDTLSPVALVDAIIAKKNLGTSRSMAPFTVALGPGFEAGKDVDAVIETQRGHRLGVIIKHGCAAANTGVPGIIGGFGKERVMHSPAAGVFRPVASIGDIVEAGQTIAFVESIEEGANGDGALERIPVVTPIYGKVRGMLHEGLEVPVGFKVADVDPRGESTDHLTCSDKARAISGSVLEAIMGYLSNRF